MAWRSQHASPLAGALHGEWQPEPSRSMWPATARSVPPTVTGPGPLFLRRVRWCRGRWRSRRGWWRLACLQQPALLDLLLQHVRVRDHELDAAVLRPVEFARVGNDGLGLAVALHRALRVGELAELGEHVRLDRSRARLGQLLVLRGRAARVGMAADLELQLRPLAEQHAHHVER